MRQERTNRGYGIIDRLVHTKNIVNHERIYGSIPASLSFVHVNRAFRLCGLSPFPSPST